MPTSLSKKKRKSRISRALDFSPSAIAHNQKDGHFYILSSVGKTLFVLDRKSNIMDLYFLDDSAYIQPEGICFDAEGNAYISNEGKSLRSNLLRINYRG